MMDVWNHLVEASWYVTRAAVFITGVVCLSMLAVAFFAAVAELLVDRVVSAAGRLNDVRAWINCGRPTLEEVADWDRRVKLSLEQLQELNRQKRLQESQSADAGKDEG